MEYIKKLLQALLDTLVPPGTIIMYGGSEVPDGYILIQNVKVYEDEFPRLYPVLAACSGLEKGNDSGRAWVKMPNPDGRVPQFTTSGSLVWKLLEASLPNIQGFLNSYGLGNVPNDFNIHWDGAITLVSLQEQSIVQINEDPEWKTTQDFRFDASKSNGTYSGNSVQPKALSALPCIRV